MTELEEKIKAAADAYYKDGSSPYSDEEYDLMIEELRATNPTSELLKDGVQEDLKGVSKKYKLPHTMGTLAKCMDEKSFEEMWIKYCMKTDVVVEKKIDGAGVLLSYKKGKLVQALSRGDTEYGEDITENIKKIFDVPLKLVDEIDCDVRGEFFMKRSTFDKYFKDIAKNPRNMAAGIIKRLDGSDCDKLNFIAYDLWCDGIASQTELGKLSFLKNNYFQVPEWWASPQYFDVMELRSNLETEGEIPCDGLVIKQNVVDSADLERRTPMKNFAFKPSAITKITKINKIIWQMPGSVLSPVAVVDPVELDGTTVERATLSNVNIMKTLGVYVGAKVEIKKAGEIIPAIVKVLEPKENAFVIPDRCPVCGASLKVNVSGFPECANNACPRKVSHRFAKIFDKLKIKGAGDAFIKAMEKDNVSIEDFFNMCVNNERTALNRYAGGINGEKILVQMQNIMATPIQINTFLSLFDRDGFGEKKLKSFNKYTLDECLKLTIDDVLAMDGFDIIMAKAFVDFMAEESSDILKLSKYFKIECKDSNNGKLEGLSFCFTGAACMPRNQLEKMVEGNGGSVKSSVTKNLSYLVTDDTESGSSKNVKAKQLKVPVITSKQFLEIIGV